MIEKLIATMAARLSPGASSSLEQTPSEASTLQPDPACAVLAETVASATDIVVALAAENTRHQAHRLETIGRCVGEFAHDFNNLLQVVSGNVDRAARSAVPGSKAHACLADAMMATERAASLVGRILAFSRGQSTTPSLIDIDASIVALRPLIASMTAGCAVDFDLGCGGWLCRAEANQLEHAVLNLVLNARDAMPDGGTLTVKTFAVAAGEHGDGAGDKLALTVADTGIGMAPDVAARAFEPFFTTKPSGRGTGLGLAQIAGFAHSAAGTARIDSAPGQGTCVTLLLPRAVPEPHEAFGFCGHDRISPACA